MRAVALAIAFTLLPIGATAQIGNPAFMAPTTRFDARGVPAPNQTNSSDQLFAQLATEGGLAEVNIGKLAADRAEATAVGDFGSRMMMDHSMANEDLAAIAKKNSISLPDEPNPAHAAMRDQLEDLDGVAFDLAYMRGQVVDHQKTTQILIWEIDNGQNADLQQFAAKTLPTVLEHLSMAREIVADLSKNQVAVASRVPD